jgi:non-heme chloroperoxidase
MANATPVVFIHGLWLHTDSWLPWVELFRERGYAPIYPGWPGDSSTVAETVANPERVANIGVQQVTEHYASIVRGLDRKPVVIGHSFGGLIAQKLLGQGLASAAVALDPAQFRGVLPLPLAALESAFPVLKNPANYKRAVPLTKAQFHAGFASAVSRAESGPLLITGGGKDRTVPEVVTKAAFKRYGKSKTITEYKVFADRGHSLSIDSGWREVADFSLAWLQDKGLN